MKKGVALLGLLVSAAVAVATAVLAVRYGFSWLFTFTGCAAMAAIVFAVIFFRAKGAGEGKAPNPYFRKDTYISRAEWDFLQVLRSVLGNKYEVCVQAPLVSVIDKRGAAFRNELFRVIDYLIVDPDSYQPLLLVELNDASHNRSDRMERDRKVADICAAAKMPLVTFTIRQSHNVPEVRKVLMKNLK